MDQKRPQLTRDQKDMLFMHLVRCPSLFLQAKNLLDPMDIDQIKDAHYLCLWRAVLNVYKNNKDKLPEVIEQLHLQMLIELKRLAELDPVTMTPTVVTTLIDDEDGGFLDWIFSVDGKALSPEAAGTTLKEYLEERQVYAAVITAANEWRSGSYPTNISKFMDDISHKSARVSSLNSTAVISGIPDDFADRPPMQLYTTGIRCMDKFMGGGQQDCEVYVVVSTTKAGKTTLMMQMGMDNAFQQKVDHETTGSPLRHNYYVTYEEPVEPNILIRMISHTAKIQYDSLYNMKTLSSSKRGDYKDYEYKRFAADFASGKEVQGELERFESAKKILNSGNYHNIDFSGNLSGQGSGGVDEIVLQLRQQVAMGRQPCMVIIDWMGLAINRYMSAHNIPYTDEYQYLKSYMIEVKDKIAIPFKCCVWVVHQLHGAEGSKASGVALHHSRALGIRNLADVAWFAFTIGNLDESTSCVNIACTAQRRAPKLPMTYLYLDGGIRTFTETADEMGINPATREIMTKSDMNRTISPPGHRQFPRRDPALD